MRVITVARKPLSGTVAINTMAWGTSGIHIEATRIGTGDNLGGGAYAKNPTPRAGKDIWSGNRKADTQVFKRGGAGEFQPPSGRWPNNVLLQHLPGCQVAGTVILRSRRSETPTEDEGRVDRSQWRIRPTPQTSRGYGGEDGTETVEQWACQPGCPIAVLDSQSGVSVSSGGKVSGHNAFGVFREWGGEVEGRGVTHYGDKGGASRYFKQVKE